jgi:pimeloyl-ACP methyl ester carboxylesterase
MEKYIASTDGINIHYEETGKGNVTVIFVHGWLGNLNWWNSQEAFLREKYTVVRMDLGGHGESGKSRVNWTSEQYAEDIKAVINQLDTTDIILVGHSMSGAYVLEASLDLPNIKALFLVDTLRDLDQVFTPEKVEELVFSHYRKDYKVAVETILSKDIFVDETPAIIKKQLQDEFLQNEVEHAINALAPLYKMDLRKIAKLITVPVLAINSDAWPTNIENNRKYFKDYNYKIIHGTGHYPMLEKPEEFNVLLAELLEEVAVQQ